MAERPNLLFLFTDEQRADTLACYGNTAIDMPNLNRLAETSTVIEQTYVTHPICTPSRASLLTGLTPHTCDMTTNNLILPDSVQCLPEMVDDDYECGHYGKWHLGDEIFPQHGFSEWRSTEDIYAPYFTEDRDQMMRSSYHYYLLDHGYSPDPMDPPPPIGTWFRRSQIMRLPEDHSRPAFLAQEAIGFLREHQDRPFALCVNILEPHMPYSSCRDDQYDPAEVILPGNAMHAMDETYPRRLRRDAEKFRTRGYEFDRPLATEEQWRRLSAKYWGMCSLVDTHLGRILDTVWELGLHENTIIVFTSDHGDMMSSHNLLTKGYMFEEATRVPFLMRMPGQTDQKRIRGPVSQIDIVPTILDGMGQSIPERLEGKSRLPAVTNGRTEAEEDIFIEWHGEGVGRQPVARNVPPLDHFARLVDPVSAESIRTVVTADNWKLNLSSIGDHELYDLAKDPLECENRFVLPANHERIAAMRDKIVAWQERTGDQADWCRNR